MISIFYILFLFISILTSSYAQVTCASGWVQYGASCYLFTPGNYEYTWDQCHANCASYPGATMLCIDNAAENDWIVSQSGGYYWIGYTDMLPYGGGKGTKQYGWVTGCSSTYTNWGSGEPNNSDGNEDYADVQDNKLWNDRVNDSGCGCEYNSTLTTTSSSPSSHPSTVPSFRPSTVPSFRPSTVPSFRATVAPSSGPTSSPTATPSLSSSEGDVAE
jgi:hypothetical protein